MYQQLFFGSTKVQRDCKVLAPSEGRAGVDAGNLWWRYGVPPWFMIDRMHLITVR